LLLALVLTLLQASGLPQADASYNAGHFAEAAAQYRVLLKQNPNEPVILLRLAASEYQLGEYASAAANFRAVLKVQPDLPPALVGLGTSLITLGRSAEAIPPLERAVKLTPADRMARRSLGHAYQDQEKFVEGDAILRQLVKEDPRDIEAWYYLGLLFFDRNYALPALEAFDKTLALQPANLRARIYRAGCLAVLGRLDEAEKAFAALSADERVSADPEFQLGYAQFLFNAGRAAEALTAAERGVKVAPDSVKLRYWRARLLAETGKLGEAVAEAERAMKLAPEMPNPRHLLVRLYRLQGRDRDAAAQAAWLRVHSARKTRGSAR
jgi:tetratricopeptide (TPR) repeat protein